MLSKKVLGGGAILDGVLIAATEFMNWSGNLHYLWAVLAVIWGIVILAAK